MTTDLTPTEFAALGDNAVLIDVREPNELAVERIPSAISIPMSTLGDHLDELPAGPFYVICHAGKRSERVAAALREQGHDVASVLGGITRWQEEGLPVEKG